MFIEREKGFYKQEFKKMAIALCGMAIWLALFVYYY